MKYYESDDELDRALFALDLEEPPADLRSNILAATVYRRPVTVKAWEVWFIGALAALVVWLVVALLSGGSLPLLDTVSDGFARTISSFASVDVLFWLAIGAGAAFWISQLNLTVVPGTSRAFRR
ncbi:MAG TPA: hypothetical protein VFL13_09345 [Candidatus Baltobacteraceae bacterium]|nr:hypothetical protein [Candidatus Baltobacteraceae bacterium]